MSRLRFDFTGTSDSGKTKRWYIWNDETQLGHIRWFGQWRKYTFFPAPNTTFDSSCLDEIKTFLETETEKHKANV